MIKKNKSILKWGLLSLISLFGTSLVSTGTVSCGSSNASKDDQQGGEGDKPVDPDDGGETSNKKVDIVFDEDIIDTNEISVKGTSVLANADKEVEFKLNKNYEIDYEKSFYKIGNKSEQISLYKNDSSQDVCIDSTNSKIVIKKDVLNKVLDNIINYRKITFGLVCKPKDISSFNIVVEKLTDSTIEGINYYDSEEKFVDFKFSKSLPFDISKIKSERNKNVIKIVAAFKNKEFVFNEDSCHNFYQSFSFDGDEKVNKLDLAGEFVKDIIVDDIDDKDGLYGNEHNYSIFTINFGKHMPYGDFHLPIAIEPVSYNVNYWYTCKDDNGETLFLKDESVETSDKSKDIVGIKKTSTGEEVVHESRLGFNRDVTVGNKISLIGANFLANCPNIKNVIFGDLSRITIIEDGFLQNCTSLEKIICKNNSDNDKEKLVFNPTDIYAQSNAPEMRIGANFLYGCSRFNQEIVFANAKFKLNIDEYFLYGCESFNSNITFNQYASETSIVHTGFLHNCINLVDGKIDFSAIKEGTSLSSIFNVQGHEVRPIAFASHDEEAASYVNGINIICNNSDVVETFKAIFPEHDGSYTLILPSGNYRKLNVSAIND